MTFARVVLLLSVCVCVGFGAWGLADPAGQVALVEVGAATPTARADVRAQYGGFLAGFGAFLFACLARREWTAVGLFASACALSGFAVARAGSALADGPVSAAIYYLMTAEGLGAMLSVLGWRAAKRDSTPSARA